MYTFKKELSTEIKQKYKARNIANVVGITEGYLSQIFQKGKTCSKKTAYAITKAINSDAEIENYFIRNK